jgi:hypothetical protein
VSWPVRIVSIMDSFDALTSPREYRKALAPEEARALIAREAGTRSCPWIVCGLLSLPVSFLRPPSQAVIPDYVADGIALPSSLDATEPWTTMRPDLQSAL